MDTKHDHFIIYDHFTPAVQCCSFLVWCTLHSWSFPFPIPVM